MSLIALNFWWIPLFICLNPLPWKFADSSQNARSFFKALSAWVFLILNSLAITLYINFLFLDSSKILIFSSYVRHRLLSFPNSSFFMLIEAMLISTLLPPSMIKATIDSKHSIKKIWLRKIDCIKFEFTQFSGTRNQNSTE